MPHSHTQPRQVRGNDSFSVPASFQMLTYLYLPFKYPNIQVNMHVEIGDTNFIW
jgi:hypothetical protein